MWEPNPSPSAAPGTRRRRRNHQQTMPRGEEGSHNVEDRESFITPRTRRRKQFRWLQKRRNSRDKYGDRSKVLRLMGSDDEESSSLPPVEALSKRTLPLHETVYLSDTSQEEHADDNSSLGSESFLTGDKEHPIFLDGCVFDAGGMILDAIKELTESPPEHTGSKRLDKTAMRRQDQDRKGPRSSYMTRGTEKTTERAVVSPDDKSLHAILEKASDSGSPNDPDLQRAMDLNRLLDVTYRQSRDHFRRRLLERRLQSSSGKDRPVTPTELRSPNELAASISPTPRNDPMTPTFLRSPASDCTKTGDGGVFRPDDRNVTPTSLGADGRSSPEPREIATASISRPSNTPARLTIRIPNDDESFEYDSCSKSLASATTVPRLHQSGKHHPGNGSSVSQPMVSPPADKAALLLNQISSEGAENIMDDHVRESLHDLLSLDGMEAHAKNHKKSLDAPSPSELLEARTYLSDLSRPPNSPSQRMLKDVKSFFDQILLSDSPRTTQNSGPSPSKSSLSSEKQRHAAAMRSKPIGPSPESNWNRCKQRSREHQIDSTYSCERQESRSEVLAPAGEGRESHKNREVYRQSSLQNVPFENFLTSLHCYAGNPCLNREEMVSAVGQNSLFSHGGERSLGHLRRGHSLVCSTSASEGEQEMALKIRLLEAMRNEASMRRYSSHEKRRRRSHSPVTRRRFEQAGPLIHAASFDSIPGNRLTHSTSFGAVQTDQYPNPSRKVYLEAFSAETAKLHCHGPSDIYYGGDPSKVSDPQNLLEANPLQERQNAAASLLDRKYQSEESNREDFLEIMSVESSLDWQKLAHPIQNYAESAVERPKEPTQQNQTASRLPGSEQFERLSRLAATGTLNHREADVLQEIVQHGDGVRNDTMEDEAKDDVIEIISSSDSSVCGRTQQNRGTKFPPFSILPEIPEIYSNEGEDGIDAELFLRKKHTNVAPSEGFTALVHAPSQLVFASPSRFHRTNRHRKSSMSHSESSAPLLEIVSSSGGVTLDQGLLIPRLGGPENILLKKVNLSQSISDVSSQQTFDRSMDLCDAAPGPHGPDKRSKRNNICPASYIRPPVNCGKKDAPGVTFLDIISADQIDPLKYQEGFRFLGAHKSERDFRNGMSGSLRPRTHHVSHQTLGYMHQITGHKSKAEIPIVSGKEVDGSRRQRVPEIIVLDSSFDIVGPFANGTVSHSKEVSGVIMDSSSIVHEGLQSCLAMASDDSVWHDEGESKVSSIFRGLSTFFSEAAKKEKQSYARAGAGTKENPFLILESSQDPLQLRDLHTGFQMTQIKGQAEDHVPKAGVVLLQPNINIYAANPTSASVDIIEEAGVPALLAPGSADLNSSVTQVELRKVRNVDKKISVSAQKASEDEAVQESVDSSSDEHTVIFIEDISSGSGPLDRVDPPLLRPTSSSLQEHKRHGNMMYEEEKTAIMQQELKVMSTSMKNLEHKIAKVDKILSCAIKSVTESVPLTGSSLSTRHYHSLENYDEDDDGLHKEISNLAESEESLRRELAILRCLPSENGDSQICRDHNLGDKTDSRHAGSNEVITEPRILSRRLESAKCIDGYSDHKGSFLSRPTLSVHQAKYEPPLHYFNAKAPADGLMLTSKVPDSVDPLYQPPKASRVNFAVLHSRLQENIEVVYLDESTLCTDEASEEIEAIFVEERFITNEFFKYGESKGMLFDWIRPSTKSDGGRLDTRAALPRQETPPTSKPLKESGSISIPKEAVWDPMSSSGVKQAVKIPSQLVVQCKGFTPSHTQANVNPSVHQSYQSKGKEIISLLDIDEGALEESIFRKRSDTGPLQITPRVSSLTNYTTSRASSDFNDSSKINRPRRTGSDPPATGITIDSNSAVRTKTVIELLQSGTSNDEDADLINLKRRVEAVLNRSADTFLTSAHGRTDSADDENIKRATDVAVSGNDVLCSMTDNQMSHLASKNCAVNERERQLKEFIARGKSLINSSKSKGSRNRAAGEEISENTGAARSIFSFDNVLDEADRILSNIGVTNGITTGTSLSVSSDDDDTDVLSQAQIRRHTAASRLHVETALEEFGPETVPSFPDLLAPLTLAPELQTAGAASHSASRVQSTATATPLNDRKEDTTTHRRANGKVRRRSRKCGTVEIAKSSTSPRSRTKVYQWKLGQSLKRAIRKKTGRQGAMAEAEMLVSREAACPRTVAESDDSQSAGKLPSKLFFVPL